MRKQRTITHLKPLIQVNLGELALEMYNLYSALSITVTIPPVTSNHFIALHLLQSIASLSFMCRHHSYPCPQPLSIFSWAYHFVWLPQPQSNTFTQSSSPFLKTCPYHCRYLHHFYYVLYS